MQYHNVSYINGMCDVFQARNDQMNLDWIYFLGHLNATVIITIIRKTCALRGHVNVSVVK